MRYDSILSELEKYAWYFSKKLRLPTSAFGNNGPNSVMSAASCRDIPWQSFRIQASVNFLIVSRGPWSEGSWWGIERLTALDRGIGYAKYEGRMPNFEWRMANSLEFRFALRTSLFEFRHFFLSGNKYLLIHLSDCSCASSSAFPFRLCPVSSSGL